NSGGIVGLFAVSARLRRNSGFGLRLAPLEIFAERRAQSLLALSLLFVFQPLIHVRHRIGSASRLKQRLCGLLAVSPCGKHRSTRQMIRTDAILAPMLP